MRQIPSLIDMHVHFRQPGFEEKETIETGIKCAKRGGFSGVVTMPNTNPVADNPEVLEFILKEAKKYNFKIYPACAITYGLNSLDLVDFDKLEKCGAVAFSNDGLPLLDKEVFLKALKSEKLILSHCEEETKEVTWQIEMFKKAKEQGYKPRLHFCHISKKESVEVIRKAKNEGLEITAETAPHYFTFTKQNVDKTGVFKMNPPLGDDEDKKAIIQALKEGVIDVIATDHAPHTKEEKLLDYKNSPNGIIGLEVAFSLAYMTFGLDVALEKMAYNPRKILKIKDDTKIKVNLEEEWIYNSTNSKCKIAPYFGMKLKGKIINE